MSEQGGGHGWVSSSQNSDLREEQPVLTTCLPALSVTEERGETSPAKLTDPLEQTRSQSSSVARSPSSTAARPLRRYRIVNAQPGQGGLHSVNASTCQYGCAKLPHAVARPSTTQRGTAGAMDQVKVRARHWTGATICCLKSSGLFCGAFLYSGASGAISRWTRLLRSPPANGLRPRAF